MSDFTFVCPKCKGPIKADTADAGIKGECPTCKGMVLVPNPALSPDPSPPVAVPPPPSRPTAQPGKEGAGFVITGWICFGLGMVLICLMPFSLPLFIASFALGIAAIVMKRAGQGAALIVCSLLVPILSAIILPLLLAGGLLGAVGLGTLAQTQAPTKKAPPTVVTASRQPAPRVIVSPVKKEAPAPVLKTSEELVYFLGQMEGYSRAYVRGDTAVKKDEIKKEAIEKARALLNGKPATISVIIKDVSAPDKNGLVRIKTGDVSLGGYAAVQGKTLSITMFDYYGLEMNRDQALSVTPGSELELIGHLWFETDTQYVYGHPFPEAQPLFRVGLDTFLSIIGAVVMKDVSWRIIPAVTEVEE